MNLQRLGTIAGSVAAALVVAMLSLVLATGTGQDGLQWVTPPDDAGQPP